MKLNEAIDGDRWGEAKLIVNGEEVTATINSHDGRIVRYNGRLFIQFCETLPLELVTRDDWEPVTPGPKPTEEEQAKWLNAHFETISKALLDLTGKGEWDKETNP